MGTSGSRAIVVKGPLGATGARWREYRRNPRPCTFPVHRDDGGVIFDDANGPKPQLVHDDAHLLAVNKPAGWLSQATPDEARTIGTWVAEEHGGLADLPHRLDRPVSGILLAAKTKQTQRWLGKQFSQSKVRKWYLAVVRTGHPPKSISIREPIIQVRQGKMATDPRGKPALTDVVPVDFDAEAELALVAVSLRTGRTHQARVHLAAAVGAIVGDRKYGDFADHRRIGLHACRVELPGSGKVPERTIVCRPGPDFFALCGDSPLKDWAGELRFS